MAHDLSRTGVILLPTDFSENALNAAIYAVRLFGTEGNRFMLLHTFISPLEVDGFAARTQEDLAQDADAALRIFEQRVRKGLAGLVPVIERVCEHGDLPNAVERFAEQPHPPQMVVMGTQGASGLQAALFGSNTAAVIARSALPVLAVPERTRYRTPRHILLADDGGAVDRRALAPLLDIARWSHSEITVVRVGHAGDEGSAEESIYDTYLGAIPHSHQHISGENVERTLNEMADQGETDLLVVLHRQRGPFETLFHRSAASELVMHTHVPMLVLHQPQN